MGGGQGLGWKSYGLILLGIFLKSSHPEAGRCQGIGGAPWGCGREQAGLSAAAIEGGILSVQLRTSFLFSSPPALSILLLLLVFTAEGG